MKSLKQVLPNETVNEDLGLFVKDIFPKYFELQSKDREQLSATETTTLSSIFEYFKCIKIDLAEKYGISLDTTQIIFVAPPLADWDTDVLRALFLEAGWITAGEDESKLMLVPFIEAHVNYLQTSGIHKENFQREEKYMLLFMQLTEEGDKVIYTSVCFQMQCAKELIAVSKKLACSDFLLVPSILSTKSICLSAIDNTLQSAIERIIVNSRNNHKIQHGVESRYVGIPPTGKNLFSAIKGTAAKVKNNFEIRYGVKSEDSKIAASLTKILFNTKHSFASELTIGSFLPDVNFEKYQLLDFKDYTGVHLLTDLTHDSSIQQHTRTVCNFLQESISEYGTISNSPDGVRRVILSYDGQKFEKGPHCVCIEKALFKANLIKPQVKFSQVFGQVFLNQTGALQRSLKISQIVNTLLPALILNEEKSNTATSSKRLENDSIVLPLNSFYLEAYIGKQQINFILNKVVKASTTKTHAELFTAEERAIEIDDIRTATSGILWRHYQLLESEGHLDELINCWQEHEDMALSLSHYQYFTANMMKLIDDWFRNKKTLSNGVLDAYHLISLNKDCSCALKISYRMLLETGLKPAISCIAKTIVGTVLSNDHFGQYQLSALLVKGGMSFIDNVYCSDCLQRHLGERLAKFFLNHHQKPVMYFVDKETEHALGQYPTRENFTHISNLTLTISLRIQTNKSSFSYGYLDDQCDVYIDLPGTYFHDKHYLRAKHLFETEYTILSKGNELPSTGLKRTYVLPECIGADISKLP